jgi:hypothetical protein
MSADNGIYILKTKAERPVIESDFEYRVIHAQCIENIYWDIEKGEDRRDDQFTPEIAYDYFGKSPVLLTSDLAWRFACELEEDHSYSEYGICRLDHSDQVFQTFTDEEIEAFDKRGDELLDQHHQKREAERQSKLEAATIRLGAGMTFEPGAIYGYLVKEDGTKVHGSLSGVQELRFSEEFGFGHCEIEVTHIVDDTGAGDRLEFLPSDWHKAPEEFPCGHPRLPGEDICSGLHCNDDLEF